MEADAISFIFYPILTSRATLKGEKPAIQALIHLVLMIPFSLLSYLEYIRISWWIGYWA